MKNKIHKLLSIGLAVMVVFSCCSVAFTAFADITSAPVYYVSASGDDEENDGLTPEFPVATVGKAIEKANSVLDEEGNQKYVEGDTVFIKLVYVDSTSVTNWSSVDAGADVVLPAHDYKLNISSHTSKVTVGNQNGLTLNGPVTFDNVKLSIAGTTVNSITYRPLIINDNNVTLTETVSFSGASLGYTSISIGNSVTNNTVTEDQEINMSNRFSSMQLSNSWGDKTYDANITVNIDNAKVSPTLYFSANNGTTVYNKNVNINIKNASGLTFSRGSSSGVAAGLEFGQNGAVQIINSAGLSLTDTTGKLSEIVNNNLDEGATAVPKYVLNNTTTEYKEALAFTETAGVFDVREGYSVIATKADNTVVISAATEGSQDVVLDLREAGAGTYTYTVTKSAATKVVYVSAEGSTLGDGSEANPVSTIREAVLLGKEAGLDVVDTLNVKTVGSAVNLGILPLYHFNLHVESASSDTVTTISVNKSVSDVSDKTTSAYMDYLLANSENCTTRYSNVTINASSKEISLNQSCLKLDSDVTVTCNELIVGLKRAGDGSAIVNHSQTVEINANTISTVRLSGSGYNNRTYKEDLTIVVNNTSTKTLRFTGNYGPTVYKKNVNINVKKANASFALSGSTIDKKVRSTINGALQVIDSSGIGINSSKISDASYVSAGAMWFITNDTGDVNALDFTSTAGLYKINLDTYVWSVKATDSEGNIVATEKNGYLDLTTLEADEYTVIKEKNSNLETTYYVSATGSDSAAGTETEPLLSVNGAIQKANLKGYSESDTVYVKVLGTTGVLWRTYNSPIYLDAYKFKLDLSSATSGATVGLRTDTVTSTTVELNGPTKISNIKIANSALNSKGEVTSYIGFGFYGNDVEIGEGVTFASYYITYQLGVWDANLAHDPSAFTYNDDINVIFKSSSTRYLNLANNYASATFKGNINVTVDHASANPYFYFSCNNAKATYNKNVNLNFKQASSITLTKNSGGSHAFGENAAIQIINSTGKAVTSSTGELANITAPKYILTNGTTNKDLIDFTSSTGVYDVNVDLNMYTVKATRVADEENGITAAEFTAEDGQLVIEEAGEYTITCEKKKGITGKYYISAAGDDSKDGKTENTAVKSISKAVVLANEAGYDETDTVEFYIIGSDAVDYSAELSVNSSDRLPDWVYTAVFKANDPNTTKAKITFSKGCTLGGNTRFESVEVSASGWEIVRLGFHNVVFDEKSSLGSSGPVLGMYHSGVRQIGATTNGVTVELKGSQAPYGLYFTNQYGGVTHNGPVTVKINKFTNTEYGFYLGKTDAKATYKNALNLSLKSIDRTIKFLGSNKDSYMLSKVAHEDAATPYFTFADGAAFQFINSTGKNIMASQTQVGTDKETGEAQYYQSPLDYIDPSQKYILTNNTDNKDLLDFTAEIGTFSVNGIDETRYFVRATSKDGSVIKDSANGKLTVPAGEYTITIERTKGLTKDYYVQAGGSENADGTSEKPFATIAEAIKAAKTAQYIEGDIITVKVAGETAVEWGTAEDYDFLLKVVSADTENKSTVNAYEIMTGDVEFDDIAVQGKYVDDDNPRRLHAVGYNITLGANASLNGQIVSSAQNVTNSKTQTITINNAFNYTYGPNNNILVGGYNQNGMTYEGDLNYVINNANAAITFGFMPTYGKNVTIKGNFNINANNVKSISFDTTTKAAGASGSGIQAGSVTAAASQLVLPGSATLSDTSVENFKTTSSTYYIVRNNTGENVDFTATAGVYTVGGTDVVYAYKDGVKVAESNNGVLDLATIGVGEYVLIKVREPKTFEYTNSDGTTIAAMIKKAINNGAIEGDKLQITLTGTTAIEYGTPVDHLFDVEIISTESTPVSFVKNAIMAGDTKFDGVKVSYPGGESWIFFGGHDVEITAASSISGGYYMGLASDDKAGEIDGQTVIIKCDIGSKFFSLAGDNANVTYTGDLNVTLGHASTAPRIYFGMSGNIVYNGRVNLDLGASSITSFTKTATFANGFNIISENPLSDTVYTSLSNLNADVYTVYNKTGVEGILGFGDASGKFTVSGEDKVRAIDVAHKIEYADSVDGVITLNGEGNYFIGIPSNYSGDVDTNDEYIIDRTALNEKHALNNVAAKIANKQDINIVYYGGSVTAGTGSSNGDKTSWRGIISSWLEVNVPNSKVTNINSAIGGTGSFFGYYRLQRAVLDHQPDLLFIEFSINDYYDGRTETQAAAQFESIIRKVRTKAPECDIVMVLTTEKGHISSLQQNNTLHEQARAHDKIAAKYGIPALRVGHALADQLYADMDGVTFNPSNDASMTAWSKYFPLTNSGTYDIVHPNDVGYRIYGNVIEEYLEESLLGTKNENAVVTEHIVPDNVVSEKIWAGGVTFIAADAELSAESKDLGGSKFTVKSGPANQRNWAYGETFYAMNNTEDVLMFKFTGTELSILEDQYSSGFKGVNVSIDGSEETYVKFENHRPTVIASGLTNTEHTAAVRVAEVDTKDSSQWVYGFYVRNEADDIEKAPETKNYYVSSIGSSDATGTEGNPFLTIVDAINCAKEYGLGSKDIVNIYIDGSKEAVRWGYTSSKDDDYAFALNVESLNSNTKATLNYGQPTLYQKDEDGNYVLDDAGKKITIQSSQSDKMRGTTEIDNIIIKDLSGASRLNLAGYSVTFGENATFSNINNINVVDQEQTVSKAQTVIFNNVFNGTFRIGNHNYAGVKFNSDLNIYINNSSSKFNFTFSCAYGGANNNFNGDINVIVKDATSISFGAASGIGNSNSRAWNTYANGDINVLIPSNLTLSDDSKANLEALSTTGNIYYLINDLGDIGTVNFVEGETGTFDIYNTDSSLYRIILKNPDGSQLPITGNRVVLSEPGEYRLTYNMGSREHAYTLSANGELNSIEEGILKAIDDGYGANDIITFYISGETTVPWGATLTEPARLTDYEFKLIITTAEGEDKRTVGGEKKTIALSGPTEFKNIVVDVDGTKDAYPTFGMGGNDVTFNSDVSVPGIYWSLVTGRYHQSLTVNEAMDLYIANSLTKIQIGNANTGNTYNADVNITYNNASASPTFTFGTNDKDTNFKKNVNFNLMAAKGVNFASVCHTFAVGSAIQVINSSAATVTLDTGILGELVDTEGNALPKYIITNKTGEADAISFTDVAGTYNLDIPKKEEGCYAVFTNISTDEVIEAKNDSVILPAGEYTFDITRAPKDVTFDAQEGDTLANAIKAIIDQGYGYGDNITLNLGSIASMDIGVLPRYNFNLVVKSDVHTQIVVGSGYSIIANNQGFHTHYKNVEFYKEEQYKAFTLMGSSATFDKDVNFNASYATLAFGATADENGHVALESEQKVVLDCVSPRYIELSSWLYSNRTYNDDVTLVVNNYKSTPIIHFNSYNEGYVNGATDYLSNININVKDANSVEFDYFENATPGGATRLQLVVDGNTSIDQEQVAQLNEALGWEEMYYVVDKTFQRGIIEFTDEVGVYKVNTEYKASAAVAGKYDPDEYEFVDIESDVTVSADENNIITLYNNDEYVDLEDYGYEYSYVWEVRTNEYFEDFNDKTLEVLKKDWKFSSDSSEVSAETEIVDGKVKLPTQTNLKEAFALNKNINISSKDQYISVDLKGSDFGYYGGLEILARLGGNYKMDAYSFHIANPFITLQKVDGNDSNKSGGYYSYNTTGIETEGLWGRIPGSESVKNEYTFNSNHTYRVSFSVTTGTDGEDEVAYIRGIVLNLNTNEIMFDETFKDSSPYLGTEFAIIASKTKDTNPEVCIDNLYFSSEKFRDGDEGILDGDINGDGVYDIRDLVYTNENEIDAFDVAIINKADKNVSGSIDNGDYVIITKEILANKVIGGEFDRTGTTDAKAKEMRDDILATTSAIVEEGGKKYYTASNRIKKEITGDIWYVSDTTTEGSGTEASPWTLAQLQAQINLDVSTGNYIDRKVQEGDAVLFKRGSVFRTNNLMLDVSTSEPTADSYSYLKMSEGVLYGAYDTGAKPRFIDSYKNYAKENAWVQVEDNIWKINAPEIIIDKKGNERIANGLYANDNSATNIVFNGAKIGVRRSYPASGDLYTLYKDGHFTYDETTGDLYIYSKADPTTYDSIEVSRAIYAIQVNTSEKNFVIDNLAFHGFGNGTVYGAYGNNNLSVTNCEFGYSGGAKGGSVRYGNAVGLWCGGTNVQANYNWIYQTWDSAISPQGSQGADYTGFQVIGNLLEYNNCDIEIFDTGSSDDKYKKANPVAESFVDKTNEAIWNNCEWTDNLMRFTTLGWGSREADKIRGIQGVIRGSFTDAQSVDVDWCNNTIDTPGMEIFRLDNTTDHTDTYTVKKDKSGNIITDEKGNYTYDISTTVNAIFKFGVDSELGNNTYYFNPYVRNTSLVVRDYMTATPAEYAAVNDGAKESTSRTASTAAQFYNALTAVDNAASSSYYWGTQQVTSGN